METREQNDRETTATAVVEGEYRCGYAISGVGAVTVDPAAGRGEDGVVLNIGSLCVFVSREHLPALIAQLLAVQAHGPVSA